MSELTDTRRNELKLDLALWGKLLGGALACAMLSHSPAAHAVQPEAPKPGADPVDAGPADSSPPSKVEPPKRNGSSSDEASSTDERPRAVREKPTTAESKVADRPPPETSVTDPPSTEVDENALPDTPYGRGAVIDFNKSGSTSIRFITWHQVWGRFLQHNPGSTVNDVPQNNAFDIGLRRSRFLAFGKLDNRARIMMHFGINNQTFNNAKKPQLFVHDAWVEFSTVDNYLDIGAGLHYWNGISRMSNASTLNFLALDSPILHWATIERSDQFARQFGVYAKGKLGAFDYRVAVNKPFASSLTTPEDIGAASDFNSRATSVALAGYFKVELWDAESNALPYSVGTYLGKKSVLNVGAGFHWQPDGMHHLDANDERVETDIQIASGDVFVDTPVEDAGAITAYASYSYYGMGPGHIRNIGIMNIAQGGEDANGAGNAYPSIGTGHHGYAQAGYLLPEALLGGAQLQPYVGVQVSGLDARIDVMAAVDAGINWYLIGHHAKLTLDYRNRPLYGTDLRVKARLSEVILQAQVFL